MPRNEKERAKLARYFADVHDQTGRGFDHDRYPVWRDWIENHTRNPRRARVIEQLRQLGILDLPKCSPGSVGRNRRSASTGSVGSHKFSNALKALRSSALYRRNLFPHCADGRDEERSSVDAAGAQTCSPKQALT